MPSTLISLAQLLKSETLEQHQAAENLLSPKLEGIVSQQDYSDILKTFYGFYTPVEEAIASVVTTRDLSDIQERNTARYIIDDLLDLGENVFDLPICTSLPVIKTKAQAFGALYVLEGSTLGGRMIRKMMLKKHGGMIRESQLNFFNGYGDETAVKWRVFQESLELVDDKDDVIAAANETFTLFQKWIKYFLYDEQDRA